MPDIAVDDLPDAPATLPDPPTPADAPSPAPEAPAVVVRPETVQIATFEALQRKKKRRESVDLLVEDEADSEDAEPAKLRLWLESITGPEYDELVDECPPSREQAARGLNYDPDKFEPLLLTRVVVEPAFTKAQWASLRKADNWSGGEWASLVLRAQNICMRGLDVPFASNS